MAIDPWSVVSREPLNEDQMQALQAQQKQTGGFPRVTPRVQAVRDTERLAILEREYASQQAAGRIDPDLQAEIANARRQAGVPAPQPTVAPQSAAQPQSDGWNVVSRNPLTEEQAAKLFAATPVSPPKEGKSVSVTPGFAIIPPTLGRRQKPVEAAPPAAKTKPEGAVEKSKPLVYPNKAYALDDAVNWLEEGANQDKVINAFAKIGVTWDEIVRHGKERNSEYFKQQDVPPVPSDLLPFGKMSEKRKASGEITSLEPKPKDQSVFRQVADLPLGYTQGVIQGIRMIADTMGAEKSKNLRSAEDYIGRLMSAQSRQDKEEQSKIMKEAEDKGALDQVKAGLKALSVAPVQTLINAFGTSAPAIIAGAAATALGAPSAAVTGVLVGTGALMGAGSIKGAIYEVTKEELEKIGVRKEKAEKIATEAQKYGGYNLDQILLGTVLGAGASAIGMESGVAKALAANIIKKSAVKLNEQAEKQSIAQITRALTAAGLKEGTPEFAQGFQEMVAKNVALQREGFNVPTYRGAVAAGTLEGLAGVGLGVSAKAAPMIYGATLTPEQKFARALQEDIDATRFTQEGIQREAREAARGITPETLAELAARRAIKPPPQKPKAEPAEGAAAPEGRVEPSMVAEPSVQEPAGRVEPIVGPAAPVEVVPRAVEAIPGMPTGEELAEPEVTPVTKVEAAEPAATPAPAPAEQPVITPITPAEAPAPAAAKPEPSEAPAVKPTKAAESMPETPTVPPVTAPKIFEPPAPMHATKGLPTVEVPLAQLRLSKDVPQFKLDATAEGVVEALGGKFERVGVAPIQVWRRLDGSLEIISGRHRFDLAKRSGETTIPSQIHDEALGFDKTKAATLDAELNIRDGQGKVKDYVNYFKESGIDRKTAESRGLLARATGKRSFTIANQGSDELITAVRSDQIGDEAAYYIALNAPSDARLQGVGIKAIMDNKSMNTAINMMQAVKALAGENETTTDMFGFDDSAIKEAEEMAKIAASKQREIQTRLSAISGAARNPAVAKAEGIDIRDPEAVKRRIDELRQKKSGWENWSTNPDLVAEVRAARGVAAPELNPIVEPLSNQPAGPSTLEKPADNIDTPAEEAAQIKNKAMRDKLMEVAKNLGVRVFEASGRPMAGDGYVQIPPEDKLVEGSRSAEQVFAHELGHAIMQNRGMSFNSIPHEQIASKWIKGWTQIREISKAFRPEVYKNKTPKIRRYANKPNEIIADALGSFLLGQTSRAQIQPLLDGIGLSDYDLGLKKRSAASDVIAPELTPIEQPAAGPALELTAPTPQDLRAKDEGRERAEEKAIADREVDLFQLQPQVAEKEAPPQTDLFAGEAAPSAEYQVALEKSRRAGEAFRKVQEAYRKKEIGDEDFLAGRRVYDAAMEEYDRAYRKERGEPESTEKDAVKEIKTPEVETPPIKTTLENIELTSEPPPAEQERTALNSKGQPIHTTPDGIRNFWRWFGDSKVVDKRGRPLVVYHGTSRDFSVFDRLKSTEWRRASMDTVGSWFSDQPSKADKYAGGEGLNVMPVYLSIKNPKLYRSFDDFLREMHEAEGRKLEDQNPPGIGSAEGLRAKLKAEGYDGIQFEQTDNESLYRDIKEIQESIARARDEEVSVKRTDRAPYTMKRERLESTLRSMKAELNRTGGSTEFDGHNVFVALDSTQIKSAVGNEGSFNADRQSILENIDTTATPSQATQESNVILGDSEIRKRKIKEYAKLRREIATTTKKVAAGEVSIDMQRNLTRMMQTSRELQTAIRELKPRRDSAEVFLAKALKEYDEGNLEKDVLDVIQAAYRRTPELLDGLLLRVIAPPKGKARSAGNFDPFRRAVTLYKRTEGVYDPVTIRHELTHSLEQMMTPEQRMAVVQAWGKALQRAIKQNPGEPHQKYFHALLDFFDNPTEIQHRKTLSVLPSYDMYQFINPSEFWAVNAEKLMAAELGSAWAKFKRAVRKLLEGMKKVLGFDSKYDIHKVFNQVMGGSKERISYSMLVEMVKRTDGDFTLLNNIEENKQLVQKYNRPKTPMLDTSPIKTFITKQFQSGKEFVRDVATSPIETTKGAANSVIDGMIYLRNQSVWYGSGLEARDFDRYNGELRTSEGIVTASVALDNAIRSGNIGVEVIFKGGIEYNKKLGNYVAVDRDLGMHGVYKAEAAMKKKLGDQLGTDIIQGYLEAKRSISIMNELYEREAAFEAAKTNHQAMKDMKADADQIAQAKSAEEELAKEVEGIKKAASSVNMSEEEMYEFAALDEKHPELRDMMENWNAINQNLLTFWRQVGLLSQGRYEALSAIKDYVPWYRIMNDELDLHDSDQSAVQSTTRSMTNIGVEKLFKRGRPISVVDFRAKEGQKDFKIQPSSVVTIEVNGKKVNQDLISVTPSGEVHVEMDLKENDLVVFKTNREIQNIVDNMTRNVMRMTMNGIRQFAANRIVLEYASRDAKNKIMVFPSVDKNKGRFNWVVNGKKVVVEIRDPLVAAAIYGMDNLNLRMLAPLAAVANFTRRTITLSGVFQIKQVFKDAPTAAIVTGVKNPMALIGGVWKGFLTSLTKTDPVVDILKSAGIGGFMSPARTPEADIKLRLGIMNGNVFSSIIKFLDHIGDSSDMAQRVATYKRVLAETGDETQALYQAANVINFLHHGASGYAQAAVKTVPFMGAYANSIDVLIRALMGGGLKGMSRTKALARLTVTASLLAGATLLYCMLAGADPDYDELDDQTKLKNIIIPGTKIMLPMNTSAAYFFKAIPEMIYNKVTREGTENEYDRQRLRKALGNAAREMLLGPEPVPAGIKPVVEVGIKHSFFTGRPIVPEGLKDVAAAEQYTATTSELGKKLSAMMEIPGTDGKRVINPIEADHLVRGLFGTAGAMVQWISNSIGVMENVRPELMAREQPITGSFLRDEVPRGREDLFYDFKKEVFEKHKTWKKMVDREDFESADKYLEKHGDVASMYKYINKTEQRLKKINAEIRRLGETRSKDMTPKERREEIDELRKIKQELFEPVKEMRREVLNQKTR